MDPSIREKHEKNVLNHLAYVFTWYVSVAARKTAPYSYDAYVLSCSFKDSLYEYDLPIYDALEPPPLQLSTWNFQDMCPA